MLSFHWGTADGVEDINRYVPGGFHPVHLGNTFRSDKATYRVLNKLGHGSFSTVWLARTVNDGHESSSGRYVALKICVADADPRHELAIHAGLPRTHQNHVIQLLDSFSLQGPNGTHVVLVHNVLGSLRDTKPPTLAQLRQLCRQIVQGVSFLHSRGVVHGDLHTGNIGICLPTLDEHSEDDILDYFGHPEIHLVLPRQPHAQPESLPLYQVPSIELGYYYKQKDASFTQSPLCVEIMDLAALAGEDPRPSCIAPAVCAPEIMFNLVTTSVNSPSTFESDIWSLAFIRDRVWIILFHWARPNDALLEKMAKLCGEMSPEWQEHIPDVASTISAEGADAEWEMLVSHLTKDWNAADVAEFVALLKWMMKMDPQARPTAEEALQHPWFSQLCPSKDVTRPL
ncbi:kinase-like domain-containing protein [Flammula alnicola]|nr:kinase-like domain-containing protein [Flammula alnicola]